MLQGRSQDWPLSREEKQQRLLSLYDQDLKETEYQLQLSARRHSCPCSARSQNGTACCSKASTTVKLTECTTERIDRDAKSGDGYNAGAGCAPEANPPAQAACEDAAAAVAPVSSGRPAALIQKEKPASQPLGSSNNSEVAPQTHRSFTTDAVLYTQRSIRSGISGTTEYFTPDATPRTPLGFSSSPSAPVLAGPPAVALRGSSSRLPTAPLRHASKAELPPRPLPVKMDKLRSNSTSKLHSRRPRSAAVAANAFAAYTSIRESSRKVEDPPVQAEFHIPQIFSAARHGRTAPVEAALMAGLSPNCVDDYENTLFHVACQNGNKKVAKLVVKYGCNMNAKNSKGNTGLHFLFSYGYPELAEYFISKGANENACNSAGRTARQGIK